jgi:hypothetical protein
MSNAFKEWKNIEPSAEKGGVNARRADTGHPLDFWLGRDFLGQYVFYLDFDQLASGVVSTPSLSGVEIRVVSVNKSSSRLVLILNDKDSLDLFTALCADLMAATSGLEIRDNSALTIVLGRLQRWQELVKRARDTVLSQSNIIGLIGELLLLRDFVMASLSTHDAILTWRGPYGDEQDFLLEGGIIETKTQLSTSDQYLNISSENQLDTGSGPILLCHQTVYVPSSEESGGFSLNSIVDELKNSILESDMSILPVFDAGLVEYGYVMREEYDRAIWLLNTRRFFEVRDGFPRLRAGELAPGVDRVRYRISLASCASFEVNDSDARVWAFDE